MTDFTKADLAKRLVGALKLTPEELEGLPDELLAELRPRPKRKPKRRELKEKDLT